MERVVVERRPVSAEDLTALDRRETAELSTRATAPRRADFATGRLCARRAVARLLDASPASLVVLRSADGVPVVARTPALTRVPVHVSISHADGFAMAAASRVPVGIDLVTVEDHGRAFSDDAFDAGELAAWESWLGEGGCLAACVAFAAREAAYKCLQGAAWPAVRPAPSHDADAPEGLAAPRAFSASITGATQRPSVGGRGWLAAVGAGQVAVALTAVRDDARPHGAAGPG